MVLVSQEWLGMNDLHEGKWRISGKSSDWQLLDQS
jgi:hypothetical protein